LSINLGVCGVGMIAFGFDDRDISFSCFNYALFSFNRSIKGRKI